MEAPTGGAILQLDQPGMEAAMVLVVATKMAIVLIGQICQDKAFDTDDKEKMAAFAAGFTEALGHLEGVIPVHLGGVYDPKEEPAVVAADGERVH